MSEFPSLLLEEGGDPQEPTPVSDSKLAVASPMGSMSVTPSHPPIPDPVFSLEKIEVSPAINPELSVRVVLPPPPVAPLSAPPIELLNYLDRDFPEGYPWEPLREKSDDPVDIQQWIRLPETLPLGFYADWVAAQEVSSAESVANSVFSIPEALLDGLMGFLQELGSSSPSSGVVRVEEDSNDSLTSRLLDVDQTRQRLRRPFVTYLQKLLKEESEFFDRFSSSVVNTPAFEYGGEEIDFHALEDEQRKVLWDSLKATYISKYRMRAEDHVRSDSVYFNRWRGVDFVVMPALLTTYAYYRGLEKKVSMGEVKIRLYIEPINKIRDLRSREESEGGVLGADISVGDWPVRLIFAGGIHDGHAQFDFIGIGTDFRQIRRLVALISEEDEE